MTKIVFVISDIEKARNFEWVAKNLDPSKFSQIYILLNPKETEFERFLTSKGFKTYRFPLGGLLIKLKNIIRTRRILKKEKADVVHCHLMVGNQVGLIAGKLAGTRKRIYTRHFSTFHHEYFRRAVFLDRFLNSLSTSIIAISKTVEEVLIERENVNPRKIHLIHHGFNFEEFKNVSPERIEQVRKSHGLPGKEKLIVGVIARLTHWKGIQYIIPAFKEFLIVNPHSHLVLANAFGDYEKEIHSLLRELPENNYTLIRFESDSPALYKLFDIYVHTPIDDHSEAFGQTYIEALAAGIPCVFTISGIAKEFIEDGRNAMVVPHKDSNAIFNAISYISTGNYPETRIENGRNDVHKSFTLEEMMGKLENLYLQ